MFFHPRLSPADWLDVGIALVSVLMYLVLAFGALTVIRVLVPEPIDMAVVVALLAGWWWAFFRSVRTQIRALKIEPSGLRLVRQRGTPTFLPWHEIQELRRADRMEVVTRVRWRPALGVPGSVSGWSTVDCYFIRWADGSCCFPVRDATEFAYQLQRQGWKGEGGNGGGGGGG